MRRTKLSFLTAMLCLLLIHPAQAEIKLPAIVSSNMVLQRDTTVQLWGWADAKEKIRITASWLEDEITSRADAAGNWQTTVRTTNSKKPQTIRLQSGDSDILLENILFGEVWLCSGQSNMQQSLLGYRGQPTYGSSMAIARSGNPNLRLFSVDRLGSSTPLEDVKGYTRWQESDPKLAADFSAVAYFFGQQLQEILDVPVGLIHTSYGGSRVQAWISKEVLEKHEEINQDEIDDFERPNRTPTVLFNAMINPLIPFTIKGVLWYQGEANRSDPEGYKTLLPAMVRDWRSRWGNAAFPFYFVQIAPFTYEGNTVYHDVKNSAFIREAQLQCVELIPNSGIAIALDVGDEGSIHPPKKKEVADRLLLNALHRTYGFTSVDCMGPVFDTQELKDGGLLLKFEHAETGLYAFGELKGFEIAGDDKVFYPAEAEIVERRYVYVKSEKVSKPVAVRYAWRNWVEGTLYDANLLPASSFRTDNWSLEDQVELRQ